MSFISGGGAIFLFGGGLSPLNLMPGNFPGYKRHPRLNVLINANIFANNCPLCSVASSVAYPCCLAMMFK